MHALLDAAGIAYTTQAPILSYFVDVLLPAQRLVLEVNGCYWHACRKCGYSDAVVQRRHRLRRTAIRRQGYRVIEIWEHDFKDLASALARILGYAGVHFDLHPDVGLDTLKQANARLYAGYAGYAGYVAREEIGGGGDTGE